MAFLALTGGFVIGFFPIILFELRNNFYDTKTFLLVFANPTNTNAGFEWHLFYFISVLPFLILLCSLILTKVSKLFLYGLVSIFILWSLLTVVSAPTYDLNYPTLQKISNIIQEDNPTNFNIVDQLTRDNRAMALRYLLTVHGFTPKAVDDYHTSQEIYIYSKEPLSALLVDPVHEIKSFLPYANIKTWKVENNIFIYKLEK